MQGDGGWETEEEERNVTLECSLWVSAWATEKREREHTCNLHDAHIRLF